MDSPEGSGGDGRVSDLVQEARAFEFTEDSVLAEAITTLHILAVQLADEVERLRQQTALDQDNLEILGELHIYDCSEIDRLQKALDFYAKHENWSYYPSRGEQFSRSEVGRDWGLCARAAIRADEGEVPK